MNVFKLWQGMGANHGGKYLELVNKLNNITAVGEAGAGMVKATMNANGKLLKVDIDQKLMGKDKQVIEDLIVVACNNARDFSVQAAAEEAKKLQAELPDMMNMMQNIFETMNNKKPQ